MIFYKQVTIKKPIEYYFMLCVEVDANILKELNKGLTLKNITDANSYEFEIKEHEGTIKRFSK